MKFKTRPLRDYTITQRFGENLNPLYVNSGLLGHTGIDFSAPKGSEIYSVCDATFHLMQNWNPQDPANPNTLNIKLGWSLVFLTDPEPDGTVYLVEYLHLGSWNPLIPISGAYRVKEGEMIGLVGTTGFTTGPHLHFGVAKGRMVLGRWVNDESLKNGYLGYQNPESLIDPAWTDAKQHKSPNIIYNLKLPWIKFWITK